MQWGLCWDQKSIIILINKTDLSARNRMWSFLFLFYFQTRFVCFYCLAEIVCCLYTIKPGTMDVTLEVELTALLGPAH